MTHYNATTQWGSTHGKVLLAMSIDPREIGRRIATYRNARGWTQLELAQHANVSPSSVQRWEGGKLPPVRELIRLAGVLEIDAEQLVEPPTVRLPEGQSDLLQQVGAIAQDISSAVAGALERLERIEDALARLEDRQPDVHTRTR